MWQRAWDDLWFNSEPVPGAAFRLNDSVRIKSGERAGEGAAVISLLSLEPAPIYLVELGSGDGDIEIGESELEGAV